MGSLTIGELAKEAKVNIATVRYYEKRGLIERAPRTESGYRVFPPETVEDIKTIKNAQDLGFTLEEIKKVMAIYKVDDYFPTEEMHQLSKEKLVEVNEKIDQLNRLRSLLENAMACPVSEEPLPKKSCPLMKTLAEGRK